MKFEEYLKDNKDKLDSIDVFDETWNNISNEIDELPSKSPTKLLKYAFSVGFLLIISGVFIWFYISKIQDVQEQQQDFAEEMKEIKELLTANKDGVRIRAINKTEFISNRNPGIQQILIHTLQNDPSVNVKIAALNALESYMDEELVRIALIKQLENSNDNKLLLRIISALSTVNEKRLTPYLEDIIIDDNKRGFVKDEAGMILEKIKNL